MYIHTNQTENHGSGATPQATSVATQTAVYSLIARAGGNMRAGRLIEALNDYTAAERMMPEGAERNEIRSIINGITAQIGGAPYVPVPTPIQSPSSPPSHSGSPIYPPSTPPPSYPPPPNTTPIYGSNAGGGSKRRLIVVLASLLLLILLAGATTLTWVWLDNENRLVIASKTATATRVIAETAIASRTTYAAEQATQTEGRRQTDVAQTATAASRTAVQQTADAHRTAARRTEIAHTATAGTATSVAGTATAVAVCESPGYITVVCSNFDDGMPGGWHINTTTLPSGATFSTSLQESKFYLLTIQDSPQIPVSTVRLDVPIIADGAVSAKVWIRGDGVAGLAARRDPGGINYYDCWIDNAQHFGCFKWVNGSHYPLKDGSSDAILRGAWNRLDLVMIGTRLTFFVNGREVTSVDDSTFASGYWGIFASTSEGSPNLEAFYDYIFIYQRK